MTAAGPQNAVTPPDSTGAIGPLNYVEMVNASFAVYDRSLNLVSTATFDAFTGNPLSVPFCDPQIQWAPSANRWLFAFLYCGTNPTSQGFVFGWSQTADPSNLSSGWCEFAHISGSLLFDFPKLGHNGNYLILGGNYYASPTTNPTFASSALAWVPLPASNDSSCTVPQFFGTTASPLKNGDRVSNTFTPVPVNTTSSAANGYIVSAYDSSGSNGQPGASQSRVAVWHLDSAGVLHTDNDVVVNTYNPPTPAQELGSSNTLDTLPGMFTQAVGDPITGFYTQHTVAGVGGVSQVDWYEFAVSGSNVVLVQQGSVTSLTDWVFNAAISPRFDGQGAAIIYNRSSVNIDPVIAARIRYAGTAAGQMASGELVLATSTAADNDFSCNAALGVPCRWGDYAGASPDPVKTNLVWGSSEFNTATGPAPAWSDENFAIAPDRDPNTQSGSTPPPPRGVVNQSGSNPPPVR